MRNFTLHKIDMMLSKDEIETVDLSNENVESFNYRGVQITCPSHALKACKMILDVRYNSLLKLVLNEYDRTKSGEHDFTVKSYLIPLNAWYYLRYHFTVDEKKQSA